MLADIKKNPMSVVSSLSQSTGVSLVGQTPPQRMLSEKRINGILFRTLMSTMAYMFVIFIIYGIIALGLSETRKYQGKIVIVGLSLILGVLTSYSLPKIAKSMYPSLGALVD